MKTSWNTMKTPVKRHWNTIEIYENVLSFKGKRYPSLESHHLDRGTLARGQKCKPWDWTDVVQTEDPKGMAVDVIFRAKCWVPSGKLTIMVNNAMVIHGDSWWFMMIHDDLPSGKLRVCELESCHWNRWISHQYWWLSIVMLVYQRVKHGQKGQIHKHDMGCGDVSWVEHLSWDNG